MQFETHFAPGVDLLHILGRAPHLGVEIDLFRLGELPVLDLRKQQQRAVEPHEVVQRPLHLQNFAELRLGQRRTVVHEHFQPVAANGQRGLHLMRGIADELFLAFEQGLRPLGITVRRLVQPPELDDLRVVHQRGVLPAHGITVEPSQQGIEWPQGTVKHQHVDQQDRQQQEQIEVDDPPEDRFLQVVLFDGRGHHGQFLVTSSAVAEYRPQHPRRFLFVFLRNKYLLVAENHMLPPFGILRRHVVQVIAVVAARIGGRQFPPREAPRDQHLGIVLQRIVHLVVDLVDHRQVEQHGPPRQQQREGPGHVQHDAIDQPHGATSL